MIVAKRKIFRKKCQYHTVKEWRYGQDADETFRVAADLLEKSSGTKIVFTNIKHA